MITIRNLIQFKGGVDLINDRAAHLIQGMGGCPIEEIIRTLRVFDEANSPNTKSTSAKRWLKQYAGFESEASGKDTAAIIEILNNETSIGSSREFDDLLKAKGINGA